jgi:hypothetical protein
VPTFRKTKPPAAGRGRKKGERNKLTVAVKELVEGALRDAGGRSYLTQQARRNPKAFLALVGKLIPRDLNVAGEIKHTLTDLILSSQRPAGDEHERAAGSGQPN